MSILLTLYGRADCHLCEAMHEELTVLAQSHGFRIQRVDIDGHPQLEERYATDIPVLVHEEHELCHYFLDAQAVLSYLNKREL